MKYHIIASVVFVALWQFACAQITNPVTHFSSLGTESGSVLKWEADINGDGKNEIFLSLKDQYDQDAASELPSGWFAYIANVSGGTYTSVAGVRDKGEEALGVGDVLEVELGVCFIGQVAELGKFALLTQQTDNPRAGSPIARIFAYTIEGDHLVRTKLAEYDATQDNPLYEKYLKDGKRTVITPVEVNQ